MTWWKFWEGKRQETSKAEEEFRRQLQESLLRTDDLKDMARKIKRDRLQRLAETQSMTRPKLNSQTSS